MAKKTGKSKGQTRTPSNKRKAAGARAAARSGAGTRRTAAARRNTGRKTAGAKTPAGKARRKKAPARPKASAKRPAKARAQSGGRRPAKAKGAGRSASKQASKRAPKPSGRTKTAKTPARRRGGSGREGTLAQTPETGRTVRGRTNPMATRRSTGTAAGAGSTRRAPGLERQRRRLRELEENIPTPPSSLDMDRSASSVRTGRDEMREARREHNETSPVMTGGDVDADWEDAYAVGDEAPGGDNPTPDQDRVDDIGKALGVQYEDSEELKASDKITERDRHRWELDPASSEDYRNRDKDLDEE